MMTQTNNPLFNYLKYFRNTYGVSTVSVEEKLNSEMPEKVTAKTRKIFWKKAQDLLSSPDSAKAKSIFIVQNKFSPEDMSLYQPEHWEVFKKMVQALDIILSDIEVWETNEEEMSELFHFLVSAGDKENIFLMLQEPSQEKNIYSFNTAKVLETYSPLLFPQNPELKRRVWNHFKEFKAQK